MGSQLNVLFNGLYGVNANKEVRGINSYLEYAIFYHILPFDFNFRIRKKSVKLNSIEKFYEAFK